jgi:PleD family two-component response regulator
MTNSILIVNGSRDRRQFSRVLLERAGYHVREVVAMERALADARRNPPLAIVVEAPENAEKPVRFSELLRRHPVTAAVPVLVLCRDAAVAREHAETAGVSCLVEPCPTSRCSRKVADLTRPAWAQARAFGTASEE